MSKNPYIVLGVQKNATQEEIQAAYLRLKEEYRMQIHIEGDSGKKAAKKLNELEEAYTSAIAMVQGNVKVDSVYAHVETLLQQKKVSDAQTALDQVSERNAEWHYFQSAIYHQKGWAYEAKAQLEMAINMDPENQKYKTTMERMVNKQNNPNGAPNDTKEDRSYQTYENMQANTRRHSAGDCCCYLLWADCCCECCGGDLISCC